MQLHIADSTTDGAQIVLELIRLIISVTFSAFNADDAETQAHLFG